jgi:radical SAM protein with 4Fe4S-binding SPASM domain
VVSVLRSILGKPGAFTHWSDRKDPYVVTLYPDGAVGGADELLRSDVHFGSLHELSNIQDVIGVRERFPLGDAFEKLLSACEGCVVEHVCNGGALADRLRYHGTDLSGEYCDSRRRLVEHVAAAL